MRVLQVLLSAAMSYGGPASLVRNLTGALKEFGVESSVVTLSERDSTSVQFPTDIRLRLELLDEHRFGNGMVHLHYRARM